MNLMEDNQLPKEMLSGIGNRLKSLRKALELTQRELIEVCQLDASSADYLSEIESGKTSPDFKFLYQFCGHYHVNPMYLMYGDEPIYWAENQPSDSHM